VGIKVFARQEVWEQVIALSLITHDGNTITHDGNNCFYAFYNIYAEIAAVDFLLEHWEEPLAREVLGVIDNVCCIDPDCLLDVDYTSMRAVVHLDHDREVPEHLLVCNHSGLASIARVYTIHTWLDTNPMPDFSNYTFGPTPVLHMPPAYHPIGNPPTQMPANPHNLVATVLEWEVPSVTPNLHPVHTRCATPHPSVVARTPSTLALPWYGVGGVPEREAHGPSGSLLEVSTEVDAASALADLSLEVPPTFSAGGHIEEEHESHAQKRRARRKRAMNSANKLCRSMRLKEKEGNARNASW
jgi:hypothetical protein